MGNFNLMGGFNIMKERPIFVDGSMYAKGGRMSRSQKQYNKEVDDYKYFVVDLKNNKAVSGWEFKEDAKDSLSDYDGDKNFKVVGISMLKSMGIENPKESFKMMAKGGSFIGKQKNLDRNKNGRIDSEDLRMIRENKMAKGGKVKFETKKLIGMDGYYDGSRSTFDIIGIREIADDNIKVEMKYSETMTSERSFTLKELEDLYKGKTVNGFMVFHRKEKGSEIFAKGGHVSKGELVWNKLNSGERLDFLYKNFTPIITPRSQEILVGKTYNFLPKNVKIVLESKYANIENYAHGGSMGGNNKNGKYLDSISSDKKSKILKNIASHYGFSVGDAEEEVRDEDAEMLYEYIANDQLLRMEVYNDMKKGMMAKGGNLGDTIADRYARLTKTEGKRLDELSKKVRINEQTEAEDVEWDKLVHKYRGWDYANKFANGGGLDNILEVKDGEDTFYLTYIDPTHFYLSNTRDFKGSAYHSGQFRDRPFYNDVVSWLKSNRPKMAKGGGVDKTYSSAKTMGKESQDFKSEAIDYVGGIREWNKLTEEEKRQIIVDLEKDWDRNTYKKGGAVSEDNKFNYMMLGRLQTDCDYYLGNGNRSERVLWAGNIDDHIEEMKKIWNSLPKDGKPEWLSMEDIKNYENKMKNNKMEKGGKIYSETMKTADGDIIGEVRYNDHYKTYQVVIDGVIYEEFKSKAEAIENLKNAGFGKMAKGGGVGKFKQGGNVDSSATKLNRLGIKTTDKFGDEFRDFLDKLEEKNDGEYIGYRLDLPNNELTLIQEKATKTVSILDYSEFPKNGTWRIEKHSIIHYKEGGSINAKSIFKEYEENENDNYHAENILLLANNFGTEEDVETAKEILKQRDKQGSTSETMNKKSYELNKRLYPKLIDALNSNKNQTTMTEEQIQKLVRGANGTNETARNFSIKKLKEAGLDKNGKHIESKKAMAKSKSEPTPKYKVGDILNHKDSGETYKVKIEAVTGWTGHEHRYDVEFLDENLKPLNRFAKSYDDKLSKPKTFMKAKTSSKAPMTDDDYDCDEIIAEALKRKADAKKSAKKSANKPEVVKATNKVERTHDAIEKQIEQGKLKKAQIEKIIAETEDLLRMLKKALKSL
jgi:phage terminase large subunit-like protein